MIAASSPMRNGVKGAATAMGAAAGAVIGAAGAVIGAVAPAAAMGAVGDGLSIVINHHHHHQQHHCNHEHNQPKYSW